MSFLNIFFKKNCEYSNNYREGDIIIIEGEKYLICKTKIGGIDKLRITLKMIKNIK